jgi:excisionase family DNA binding protein
MPMLAFLSMTSKQTDTTRFLTIDEAARLVGLSHWTLRSWLQKGRLTRFKSGSRTLVSRAELLELTKVMLRPRPLSEDAPLTRMSNLHTEK